MEEFLFAALRILVEILIQIVIEVLASFGFDALAHAFKPNHTANRLLACAGIVGMGAFCGLIWSLLAPARLLPQIGIVPGSSLLLAPLFTGLAMHLLGRRHAALGKRPSTLLTFWGGGMFAFATAAVRFGMFR